MTELTLTGLTGNNPLGFLAALGTLRILTLAWPQANVQMKWQKERARWQPVVKANHADVDGKSREKVQTLLASVVCAELKKMSKHPAFNFADAEGKPWVTTQMSSSEYRRYAEQAAQAATLTDKRWADFAATFASECSTEKEDSDEIQNTEFRMLGGGRQLFLVTLRNLTEMVNEGHLCEALFGPWRYEDDGDGNRNLRWDPADDRRHALRWTDPTKSTTKTIRGKERSSKIWTVTGANRLAIEGLPMLPAFPTAQGLATTGFRGGRKYNTFWSWPLWDGFANASIAKSLLALPELQADTPAHERLRPLGIVEVYRVQKIVVGRYKNFTPAQPA